MPIGRLRPPAWLRGFFQAACRRIKCQRGCTSRKRLRLTSEGPRCIASSLHLRVVQTRVQLQGLCSGARHDSLALQQRHGALSYASGFFFPACCRRRMQWQALLRQGSVKQDGIAGHFMMPVLWLVVPEACKGARGVSHAYRREADLSLQACLCQRVSTDCCRNFSACADTVCSSCCGVLYVCRVCVLIACTWFKVLLARGMY